jgi:hypothetical protein
VQEGITQTSVAASGKVAGASKLARLIGARIQSAVLQKPAMVAEATQVANSARTIKAK